MAARRIHHEQPAGFAFTPENLAWAQREIAKYPAGRARSAVISLLWRAQEQHDNWLPEPAMRYVADMLAMPYIQVLEIATFYTMFQLHPVGRTAHLMVCGTTPCMLRGSEDLMAICRDRIAHDQHQVSADGAFSWEEVECIGACVNAPLVQIGKATFEDLTPATFEALLDDLLAGRSPRIGPRVERFYSAPEGALTSLTDLSIFKDDPIVSPPIDGPESRPARPALTDRKAKTPGAAANVRESAVPVPPVADSSGPARE